MRVSAYHLFFRRIADRALPRETQPVGAFSFAPGFTSTRDYKTSSDSGVVLVSSMPPGQYEIFSYEVYIGSAVGATYFRPKEPFSIPFSVAPGQTVYVGNYQANRIDGTNLLGQRVMASPFFKISDRMDADYAFVKTSKPTLPAPAVNATPRAVVAPTVQLAQ
jgi:hypothetical protein